MAKLTSVQRKRLAAGQFVFPKRRAYPLDTANRARNALARVVQHGTASQIAKVRAAVRRRYPGIKQGKK